jgi:lipopolysaccharide export system permease protein
MLVFIFIVMATRMIGMMDMLVNQGVNPGQILEIALCLLPRVIIFSMPAVCLMSVLLAFIRLSSDNEIVALNASGISLYQTLAPVIFFSLMCYIMASLIAVYWVPWGNRSYRDVVLKIIKSKADIAIKERIFFEPIDNVVFYVNSFSPRERTMKDIFVVDGRDEPVKNTIVAKNGKIISNSSSNVMTIHFMDGTIFTNEGDFKKARTIRFDTYDLNIDLRDVMSSVVPREREPNEMYIQELIGNLKMSRESKEKGLKYNLMEIKLFEMFSVPLEIFIIGIIGVPLGSYLKAKSHAKGIILSLFIFLTYYICMMGVRYIGEMGILAPSIGVWIPVLLLIFICAYLMMGATTYRSFNLSRMFRNFI